MGPIAPPRGGGEPRGFAWGTWLFGLAVGILLSIAGLVALGVAVLDEEQSVVDQVVAEANTEIESANEEIRRLVGELNRANGEIARASGIIETQNAQLVEWQNYGLELRAALEGRSGFDANGLLGLLLALLGV